MGREGEEGEEETEQEREVEGEPSQHVNTESTVLRLFTFIYNYLHVQCAALHN